MQVLKGIDGIAFVELTHRDVVRHQIVQSIINAYEKFEKSSKREVKTRRLAGSYRRRQ